MGAYTKGIFDGKKGGCRAVMPQFTEEGMKKGCGLIELSGAELAAIDDALGRMPMPDVFGGSSVMAAGSSQKTEPEAMERQIQ